MSQNINYTPTAGEFTYKGILWNIYTRLETLKEVERFEYRDSDIIVCTYPRSGTTLTQEIVWQIKNRRITKKGLTYGDNDDRFPFLELFDENNEQAIHRLNSMSENKQRLIKTHCPLNFIRPQLMKSKPKIIVVMRNPKDVCQSLYHFISGLSMFGPWKGEWSEFVEMFLAGNVFDGSWVDWNLEWWNEVGRKLGESVITKDGWQVMIVTYEDILKRPSETIKLIGEHLNEELSDDELDKIIYNCKFESMTENSEINIVDPQTGFTFLRKGEIGSWKLHFSKEENERINNTFVKECSDRNIHFTFE